MANIWLPFPDVLQQPTVAPQTPAGVQAVKGYDLLVIICEKGQRWDASGRAACRACPTLWALRLR